MDAHQAENLSRRLFHYRQTGDIEYAYQLCSEFLQNDPTASQHLANTWLLQACCWTLIDTLKAAPESPLKKKRPEALALLSKLPLAQLSEADEDKKAQASILKWGFGDPSALAKNEHYQEALDGYRRFCRFFSPTGPLQAHIAFCVGKWIQMALEADHPEVHLKSMKQALFLVCQHCRDASETALYYVLSMALKLAQAKLQGESPFQFARFLLVWDTQTFPERFWVEHSEYRPKSREIYTQRLCS